MHYQTLAEFLDEIGAEVSPARLKHLGKRMASYCRNHSYELRDVPHQQWGRVKSYPVAALQKCSNLGYFGEAAPHFATVEESRTNVRPEVAVRCLMANLDGVNKGSLWNILYRRALGCGAGEYRDRTGLASTGAVWKQLEPALVHWFESCLSWIASNHRNFASLYDCFEQAADTIPLPGDAELEPAVEPQAVLDVSSEDLDILMSLYREQPLAVDHLPYTPEIDAMAEAFQVATGRRITARQVYRSLLKRRKAGRLQRRRLFNPRIRSHGPNDPGVDGDQAG